MGGCEQHHWRWMNTVFCEEFSRSFETGRLSLRKFDGIECHEPQSKAPLRPARGVGAAKLPEARVRPGHCCFGGADALVADFEFP